MAQSSDYGITISKIFVILSVKSWKLVKNIIVSLYDIYYYLFLFENAKSW